MTKRLAVASFLAKHIVKTAKGHVDEEQLAGAISEIEIETQLEGSSFIKVHLIDPYWTLATSGFLTVSEDGLLDKIQCEFPEQSGYWWQLVAIDPITNDMAQPNLTLVFEDRIVAWLREATGEKVAPPGTTTRAQFVKALLDEIGLRDPAKKIEVVILSLNELQPVESKNATVQETVESEGNVNAKGVLTPKAKAAAHAKINKTPGLGAGAAVTVKGVPISSAQTAQANILLGEANAKGANQVATEALIFAAIAESGLAAEAPNSHGYGGVLAGKVSDGTFKQDDSTGMADAFLDGGKGFESALALSKASHNPVEVAVKVEKPSVWPENAYASETGYEHFLAEAQAIIAAGGGIKGGTGDTSGESDIGQLQRGTSQNPDESSWDCIQRLAKQVRWFAFTDGQRFFYMDGFDFRRQKPSAYLDIPANTIQNGHTGTKESGVITVGLMGTFDNTTWEYYADHKKRGRTSHRSTIAKPQTPSEIRLPLLCEPTEYRAGDVFVNQNSGPLNGRWVIANTVRKYLEDPFTTITFEPPEAPYPEPLAGSTTKAAESQLGPINSVVEAAKKALTEKAKYEYVYGAGHEASAKLFGPTPRRMDCSGFAEMCYKAAKQPDPAGGQYTAGTQEMIEHMVKTSSPQPGDLCFFGELAHTTHVNVYIGNGKSISMGAPGDPSEGPAEQMGPSGFLGYWRPGP